MEWREAVGILDVDIRPPLHQQLRHIAVAVGSGQMECALPISVLPIRIRPTREEVPDTLELSGPAICVEAEHDWRVPPTIRYVRRRSGPDQLPQNLQAP